MKNPCFLRFSIYVGSVFVKRMSAQCLMFGFQVQYQELSWAFIRNMQQFFCFMISNKNCLALLTFFFKFRSRDADKLETAASILCEQLSRTAAANTEKGPRKYDVFISYSHKNVEKAKQFLKALQDKNGKLKVFFDYEELKTGGFLFKWRVKQLTCFKSSFCWISFNNRFLCCHLIKFILRVWQC